MACLCLYVKLDALHVGGIDGESCCGERLLFSWVKSSLNCLVLLVVYSHSTRLLAATTLRNVLGTKNLAEILSERESISHTMQTALDEATDPWGVKVERVEM